MHNSMHQVYQDIESHSNGRQESGPGLPDTVGCEHYESYPGSHLGQTQKGDESLLEARLSLSDALRDQDHEEANDSGANERKRPEHFLAALWLVGSQGIAIDARSASLRSALTSSARLLTSSAVVLRGVHEAGWTLIIALEVHEEALGSSCVARLASVFCTRLTRSTRVFTVEVDSDILTDLIKCPSVRSVSLNQEGVGHDVLRRILQTVDHNSNSARVSSLVAHSVSDRDLLLLGVSLAGKLLGVSASNTIAVDWRLA